MNLSYFHVADDVPEGLKPDAAVVIDVLRATTTIAWALSNGAEAVQTFIDLNELRAESSKWPISLRVLLGERGGRTLEGFDLGNSPLGVQPEVVKGKRLFMSTTNGTRALNRVRDAKSLFTVALPNRKAVGEKLLNDQPENLCILGSGWEGSYSLEDSLAAGALAAFLLENQSSSMTVTNDELSAALALWHSWKGDLEGCLRIASHGQRLIRIGNHDDDFACCAELDKLSVVPSQIEPGILRAI
tara:strand:- start:754 stop:1485 length:732 start_codon:yes stop_codon:yes gene_type:complete